MTAPDGMGAHVLKCDPTPFHAVWTGAKSAELRKDDRGFAAGDLLLLCETKPDARPARFMLAKITHVQGTARLWADVLGRGINDDEIPWVVLSIEVLTRVAYGRVDRTHPVGRFAEGGIVDSHVALLGSVKGTKIVPEGDA